MCLNLSVNLTALLNKDGITFLKLIHCYTQDLEILVILHY